MLPAYPVRFRLSSLQKEVLVLAIPNVISNVVVPLLGLADMAVLGRLSDIKYLGGVALGTVIFNFIYWNFAFLRMGSSGLTAQAYGAHNHEACAMILSRALVVGLAGAFLLIGSQGVIDYVSFTLLDGTPEVKKLARSYFYVRIYAAPATIGMYALSGWFIGMQNSVIPMVISITVNLVSILLNILFVFKFNMKTEGVALGSLVAQYVGLALGVFFLVLRYRGILLYINIKKIFIRREILYFFKINTDIFIRTFFVIIVMTFFTSSSAGIDNTTLAVNAIFMQLMLTYAFFIDGFAYAAEALVGKYVGSREPGRLKQTVLVIFGWSLVISLVILVIFACFNRDIIALLTRDASVINLSIKYKWWLICIPVVAMFAFVWDGIYIGAAASRGMRNSLLIAATLFFALYFLLKNHLGNHALWIALYAYFIARGIYQTIMSRTFIFNATKPVI